MPWCARVIGGLLERHGDIAVIGEAGDAADGPLAILLSGAADRGHGYHVARSEWDRGHAAHAGDKPGARVLIFSMHEDTIFARRALQAGACGYVTKASAPSVLVEAVTGSRGRDEVPERVRCAKAGAARCGGRSNAADGLSAREFEVLSLLARGLSVKDIAESLGLNSKTVANHQSAIRQKLGAETAVQLLRAAEKLGLEILP